MPGPFEDSVERSEKMTRKALRRIEAIDHHLAAIKRLALELQALRAKVEGGQPPSVAATSASTTAPTDAVVSLAPAAAPTEIPIPASELPEDHLVRSPPDEPARSGPPAPQLKKRRSRRRAPPAPS
jgi:hypothetical protein